MYLGVPSPCNRSFSPVQCTKFQPESIVRKLTQGEEKTMLTVMALEGGNEAGPQRRRAHQSQTRQWPRPRSGADRQRHGQAFQTGPPQMPRSPHTSKRASLRLQPGRGMRRNACTRSDAQAPLRRQNSTRLTPWVSPPLVRGVVSCCCWAHCPSPPQLHLLIPVSCVVFGALESPWPTETSG